jgi:Tfp pilus assembly protein PilN
VATTGATTNDQAQFTAAQESIDNLTTLSTSLSQQIQSTQQAIASIQTTLESIAVTDNDLETHVTGNQIDFENLTLLTTDLA